MKGDIRHKLELVGLGGLTLASVAAVQYPSPGCGITSSIPVGASIGLAGSTGGEGGLK